MLILLAMPVVVAVMTIQRSLAVAAPSNILIARLQSARLSLLGAGAICTLALTLLAIAHRLSDDVTHGAPGWLNLVILVLLWDTIKLVLTAASVTAGAAIEGVRRAVRQPDSRQSRPTLPGK